MQTPSLNSQATQQTPASNRPRPRPSSILLVDDQRSVREAIKFLLRLDEHTVTEAADGVVALELFMRGRFDLVITDFEMPNMKGNELAARIKRVCSTQPILMISAYAEQLRDSEHPVDAILDKPFQLEDLRQAIAALL
jgi:CheY-like chemotaxis protein